MKFAPKTRDYELSPYTGLTRESWLEAGIYLLENMFHNVDDHESPVVMPPRLTQSFFIAAPVLKNVPDLKVCGYSMAEYYKNQVLRICTRGDELFASCALVICLWVSREQIWDTYTKAEKDIIAAFLDSHAHANTVSQNRRLFNMLDMAFLHMEGYPIQEQKMLDHAQAILNDYAGDGWYRDGHSLDYDFCRAFNVYGPIWNLWYGYENAPCLAKKFEENSNQLMETYGDFFDRDGWTNMWGGSNIYRNAATGAFGGNLMLRESKADPGRARRISSGFLMQLLGREDFLHKGVPAMGDAFLCLQLPPDHPFWTEKENNGAWDTLQKNEVRVTTLDGPALCFSNHGASGETILRMGKVPKSMGDTHGMWNDSKLSFNTKYPWESNPTVDVDSQQYVLRDITTNRFSRANVTFWCGEKKGVLYRRQFFDDRPDTEHHLFQALNLADFAVPCGILRVDKPMVHGCSVELTLGAYGFPDNGTEIMEKVCGNAKAIILKGRNSQGTEKQMAMSIFDGWKELSLVYSMGTNPESERSVVVYAATDGQERFGYGNCVLISQVITKESHKDFSEEELFPIRNIVYTDPDGCGAYGPLTLQMKDGSEKYIDYEGIEGKLI